MTIGELQNIFLSPSSGARLAPEDFFVLLAAAAGRDKTFLLTHPEYGLDAGSEAKARAFFSRRLTHEPAAYITGRKEFYGGILPSLPIRSSPGRKRNNLSGSCSTKRDKIHVRPTGGKNKKSG